MTENHMRMIDQLCATQTRVSSYEHAHREIIAELRYARQLQKRLDESMRRITELALRANANANTNTKGTE